MKISIITSNNIPLTNKTKKGTEIFVYDLINNLAKYSKQEDLSVTAFCSGDSDLPIKIESIDPHSTDYYENIPDGKHVIFELALISKAFSMQDSFDLFHTNIGNGDIVLPFAEFVRKPILITIHYTLEEAYAKNYFTLFKSLPNVFYVSASEYQRKLLPDLNYVPTVYHGIDSGKFEFDQAGGEDIMWVGRAIPEKGMDTVATITKMTNRKAKLFTSSKGNYPKESPEISVVYGKTRDDLVKYYKSSKLFLFPIRWEEPFGLVLIESMSCGTPVVAFARGSIPEIIEDGKTGFIVNPSDSDIRGNWIVKKTGIEGLIEAVERIYSMPEKDYLSMRKACRKLVEEKFTVEKMAENYLEVYKKIIQKSS